MKTSQCYQWFGKYIIHIVYILLWGVSTLTANDCIKRKSNDAASLAEYKQFSIDMIYIIYIYMKTSQSEWWFRKYIIHIVYILLWGAGTLTVNHCKTVNQKLEITT